MSAYAPLTETFEVPALGAVLSTSNSIFTTSITGTPNTTPTTVSDAKVGAQGSRWNGTGTDRSGRTDLATPLPFLWYDFYLKMVTLPAANTTICAWYSDATPLGGLQISPTGADLYALRLRAGALGVTTVWTSLGMATNEWHRIALRVQPNSTGGLICRVYSGADVDTMNATQDSDPQPMVVALPTLNSVRMGIITGATMDMRIDQIRADDANQPTIGSGGGSTEILSVHEDMEGGTTGGLITTANSQFDQLAGTTAGATYVADPYMNARSASFSASGNFVSANMNISAVQQIWVKFAFKIFSSPTGNVAFFQWFAPDNTTKIGDLRVLADGRIQLRDGSNPVWQSTNPITVGQWHEIAVLCNMGSSTGHRVRRYSTGNRGTINATEDSAPLARTVASSLGIGQLRFGVISAETCEFRFDRVRGDTTSEPVGAAPPGSTLAVNLGADISDVLPYATVTLNPTVTGGTGPFTASYAPVGAAPALPGGTALPRVYTAEAFLNGISREYDVTVQDSLGATATDRIQINVLQHNRFDRASAAWRPINRLNRSNGAWV